MGWFTSSEEVTDEKMIDTNGNVNNNIIIQEAQDMHTQANLSHKLLFATYVLVIIELAKLIICGYSAWKRTMKKRYQPNQA